MYIFAFFSYILALAGVSIFLSTSPASASGAPECDLNNITVASRKIEDIASNSYRVAQNALSHMSYNHSAACTTENVAIRRDWAVLSKEERKNYIDAVLCLQAKPAKTPAYLAPGAKSRVDDYVVTHINKTGTIHFSGNFLGWHRYYTWHYEQGLRNECGYKGYQPYWYWPTTAETGFDASPLFDGSSTSVSGNGIPIPGQGNVVLQLGSYPPMILPHGTGGGNVTSGPFVNMSVNLGPVHLALTNGSTVGRSDIFGYNPRHMTRDLTDEIIQLHANASSLAKLLTQPDDVDVFQLMMQGTPGSGDIGVHGAGHYGVGGDPTRDVSVAPADPSFFFHHSMIDRAWWMWQMQDPEERLRGPKALMGTGTFLNTPPSPNVTYEDVIDIGFAAGEVDGLDPGLTLAEVMSTTGGPFCYMYE